MPSIISILFAFIILLLLFIDASLQGEFQVLLCFFVLSVIFSPSFWDQLFSEHQNQWVFKTVHRQMADTKNFFSDRLGFHIYFKWIQSKKSWSYHFWSEFEHHLLKINSFLSFCFCLLLLLLKLTKYIIGDCDHMGNMGGNKFKVKYLW